MEQLNIKHCDTYGSSNSEPSVIEQSMQSNSASWLQNCFTMVGSNKRLVSLGVLILIQQLFQVSAFLSGTISHVFTGVAMLFSAVFALPCLIGHCHKRLIVLFIAIAISFGGISYFTAASSLPTESHLSYLLDQTTNQTNTNNAKLRANEILTRLSGRIYTVIGKSNRGDLRLILKTQHGNYYLSYYRLPWENNVPLQVGDSITFDAVVKSLVLSSSDKPKLFSFEGYLFRQGVVAQGRVLGLFDHKSGNQTKDAKSAFIEQLIKKYSPSEELAVLIASMLGEQSQIGKEISDLFRATGTTHVLVISGFHISTIFFALYWIFRFICSRSVKLISYLPAQIPAILVAEAGAIFYTVLSGSGLSSIRALVAVSLFGLGELCGERNNRMTTFLLVLLLVCCMFPGSALDISFQLTFAAVFGLYVANDWCRIFALKKYISFIVQPFLFSVGAWVYTLPICLAWFGSFASCAPLINAIIGPIFTIATIYMGGVALIANFLCIPGATTITDVSLHAIGFVIDCLDYLARKSSELGLGLIEIEPQHMPYVLTTSIVTCVLLLIGSMVAKKQNNDSAEPCI
uniref:Putative competence protein n=1 Tax=wastewater metagenome TaxID=527639 RepID=A0A0A8KXR8_9ZZZZ